MELFPVDMVPPAYRALADQVARARRARQERVNTINRSFGFNTPDDANRSITEADQRAMQAADALDQFVPAEAVPDYSRVDAVGRQFEDAAMQVVPQPIRERPTLGIGEAIAGLAGALIDPRGSGRGFDVLRGITQQNNEIEFANEVARYQEENARRQAILDALGQRMTTEARIADSNASITDRNNRTILQQLQGSANVTGRAATEARNRANSFVDAVQREAEIEQRTIRDILANAATQARITQGDRRLSQQDEVIKQGGERIKMQADQQRFNRERWQKEFGEKTRQFNLNFSEKQKANALRRQDSIDRLEIARQRVMLAKTEAERKAAQDEWERTKKEYGGTVKATADDKAYNEANKKIGELRARQRSITGTDADSKKRRKDLENDITEAMAVRDMYAQNSPKAMQDALESTDAYLRMIDMRSGVNVGGASVEPFNPMQGAIGPKPATNVPKNPTTKPKPKPSTTKPKTQKTKSGTEFVIE